MIAVGSAAVALAAVGAGSEVASAVTTILTGIVRIRNMCQQADSCRKYLTMVDQSIASVVPVLNTLTPDNGADSPVTLDMIKTLQGHLAHLEGLLERTTRMTRVSFVISAGDVRRDINGVLASIHLLITAINLTSTTNAHETILGAIQAFKSGWKDHINGVNSETATLSNLASVSGDQPYESWRDAVAQAAGIDPEEGKWPTHTHTHTCIYVGSEI